MEARHGRDCYIPGGIYGLCDRCAFTYRLKQLRREWTGLMVCTPCFDPRPAELSPPHIGHEGIPPPNIRPDPGDVLGENTTTAADL
jgi:hypothetical protein